MATSRDLDRDVAGAASAHQRLLGSLHGLTDTQARSASLLPGWTIGHVITHLARNADSLVRMIDGASRGEVVSQYDSAEARELDINLGADRSADELVSDVRASIESLERCWAATTTEAWAGSGRNRSGLVVISDLPFLRWRETDVHHVDLGLSYTPADWPSDYVRLELVRMEMQFHARAPMGLTTMPALALAQPPHIRLSWLLGRHDIEGLAPAGVF